MTRRTNQLYAHLVAGSQVQTWGVRAIWSRPISVRADLKLSPYNARPNLFSGD